MSLILYKKEDCNKLMNREFGLIGFSLEHSFSRLYFLQKFAKENITNVDYQLFELKSVNEVVSLITSRKLLLGLNVTIPYKETILPFLDEISEESRQVGAINVIKIDRTSSSLRLLGFNTDVVGFRDAYYSDIVTHRRALVLGTGGAARAVAFVLKEIGCEVCFVSRTPTKEQMAYPSLTPEVIEKHTLIVNATPLGMFPNIDQSPPIPYPFLTPMHTLIDLIYNPTASQFLQQGKAFGAKIRNGEKMFELQAEASWRIWNDNP